MGSGSELASGGAIRRLWVGWLVGIRGLRGGLEGCLDGSIEDGDVREELAHFGIELVEVDV